jgi:hypothetical protein
MNDKAEFLSGLFKPLPPHPWWDQVPTHPVVKHTVDSKCYLWTTHRHSVLSVNDALGCYAKARRQEGKVGALL